MSYTPLDILLVVISILISIRFRFVFRNQFSSAKIPIRAHLLIFMIVGCMILDIYLLGALEQPLAAQLSAFALYVPAIALFEVAVRRVQTMQLRAIFDPTLPVGVLKIGPYRWIRHPLYTAYMLFYGAMALSTYSLWAAIPYVVTLILYVRAALGEEKLLINSPLGEEYRAYRKTAGMFWPKF